MLKSRRAPVTAPASRKPPPKALTSLCTRYWMIDSKQRIRRVIRRPHLLQLSRRSPFCRRRCSKWRATFSSRWWTRWSSRLTWKKTCRRISTKLYGRFRVQYLVPALRPLSRLSSPALHRQRRLALLRLHLAPQRRRLALHQRHLLSHL